MNTWPLPANPFCVVPVESLTATSSSSIVDVAPGAVTHPAWKRAACVSLTVSAVPLSDSHGVPG
jgi:hypothetical protein